MNYAQLGQVLSRCFFAKVILLDKQLRKFVFLCMHAHGKCGIDAKHSRLSVMNFDVDATNSNASESNKYQLRKSGLVGEAK